ncbi:hypothetical protein ACI3PL_21045, partial [Lacticaseibacillus paracasei]
DQIMLMRCQKAGSGGQCAEPVVIAGPRGDYLKTAVAVDGNNRVWVVWAANENNNFDIHARVVENNRPGKTVRLSTDAGSDIFPVATTDAQGR